MVKIDIEELLTNEFDEMFWSIINNETQYLRLNDKTYDDNVIKMCEIVKNDKLRIFFDELVPINLSKEETIKVLEYFELVRENFIIEEKRMFLVGIKTAIHFIKKLDLFKGELNDN